MTPRAALARRAGALLAAAVALWIAPSGANAQGESSRKDASIAYAYPAGGCVGTTFGVLVGGQNLRDPKAVHVSGTGVRATILRHVRPLSPQQMQELRRQIEEVVRARRADAKAAAAPSADDGMRKAAPKPTAPEEDPVELPDHPLLRDLGAKSARELRSIADRFIVLGGRKQLNTQLAETVEIEITLDRDAASGARELRLLTAAGLSNPIRFQVGELPETSEQEPAEGELNDAPALALPALVNGQIRPGDVDRFRLRAQRGQRLVIEVSARRLTPYLADAVPGWFQATATLRDVLGREIAFSDDYRGEPDPVVFAKIPANGVYTLEIRDALYRGRDDFVYRVAIGEAPFVTRMFPLGGQSGLPSNAAIGGWNLSGASLPLDTQAGAQGTRWTAARRGKWWSNPLPYDVDELPECLETEAGNDPPAAQTLELPAIVNGRIAAPGDVDAFAFEGRAGDELVIEVEARRLGSPLDSLVSLTDAAGRVLAWNDDTPDAASGRLTHQADSYLRERLPADGTYQVRVSDAQRHAGAEYAYRLRVGPPRPDFAVFLTPSSLNVRSGRSVPVQAHVVRRDGFEGAIELALSGAPEGLQLDGASIPAGSDSVRLTLSATAAFAEPTTLQVEARAQLGAAQLVRAVVPADERMQAFIYRHLVPAQVLAVAVAGVGRAAITLDLAGAERVELPLAGTALVRIRTPGRAIPTGFGLELDEPPAGVTLEGLRLQRGSATFTLRADASAAKLGVAGNLIVEVVSTNPARRVSGGWLPAIPFRIVERRP